MLPALVVPVRSLSNVTDEFEEKAGNAVSRLTMISFLKSLLSENNTTKPATQDEAHIATAALLIEAALSDADYQDVE